MLLWKSLGLTRAVSMDRGPQGITVRQSLTP